MHDTSSLARYKLPRSLVIATSPNRYSTLASLHSFGILTVSPISIPRVEEGFGGGRIKDTGSRRSGAVVRGGAGADGGIGRLAWR